MRRASFESVKGLPLIQGSPRLLQVPRDVHAACDGDELYFRGQLFEQNAHHQRLGEII